MSADICKSNADIPSVKEKSSELYFAIADSGKDDNVITIIIYFLKFFPKEKVSIIH